jgi:hypothetical protein
LQALSVDQAVHPGDELILNSDDVVEVATESSLSDLTTVFPNRELISVVEVAMY